METRTPDAAADALFSGAGEARALARAVDWGATPLGPVGSWPEILRSVARTCMASPTPMCVWAGARFTLIHNDAYVPFLGLKSAWAMGREAREVWAEIWDRLEPDFARVFETGNAIAHQDAPYVIRRHGRDEEGIFTFTISPVQDEGGRVLALLNVSQETTPVVRAMKAHEERYRTLFESIDEGFCVIDVLFDDRGRPNDYRFVEMNPAFEHHTGLSDARGKRIRELVPEHDEHWFRTYGKVATTGEAIRFQSRAEALHRDYDVYAFRVGTPEQRRVAVLFSDITARRRAEEALRASEERQAFQLRLGDALRPISAPEEIHAVVTAMARAHFEADRCYYCEIEGDVAVIRRDASREDLPSLVGSYRLADLPLFKALLDAGRPFAVEDARAPGVLDESLRRLCVELRIVSLLDVPVIKDGRPAGILCFTQCDPRRWSEAEVALAEDVAERTWVAVERARAEAAVKASAADLREANERLREADRRKTEFLAMLSHELRNPLAPIRNSIYVLERAPPGSEQAVRAREVVRRQTEHLTRLVEDLLDVTRISHGKVPLERSRVDLREIVRKTTDDVHSTFTQCGVRLRVDHLTAGPIPVDADPTRLAQVLTNLLHNSMKFTPGGGTVRVHVAARGGHAELCVVDDGIGMDPQSVERMFEPFAQAEQSLARTKGGLGLGLALVKSIVELHGGTVAARSEGRGRGAEFLIRLPLVAAAREPASPRAHADGASPRTILVVEDNVDAAQTLSDILEMHGHRVRIATDGRSGIALAREVRPDVVLCDLGLPDVDGYEVARTRRRDGLFRGTRLVALSGYAQAEDRQRSREAGFDAHLPKPPDLDELLPLLAPGGPATRG